MLEVQGPLVKNTDNMKTQMKKETQENGEAEVHMLEAQRPWISTKRRMINNTKRQYKKTNDKQHKKTNDTRNNTKRRMIKGTIQKDKV